MGWWVIAYGNIDVDVVNEKKVLKKMKEHKDITLLDDCLYFKMEGNKGIDYSSLDAIKKWAKENKIPITIQTNEYSETGDGYYYDSEDEYK